MKASDDVLKLLQLVSTNKLQNYVLPGLSSSLVNTTVRVFDSSRDSQEAIVPHSHKTDLACLVLRGRVINTIWKPSGSFEGDDYCMTKLVYEGAPGQYKHVIPGTVHCMRLDSTAYSAGEWYYMSHDDIHSICFDRDTTVLTIEGPVMTDTTLILEPFVDGRRVPTFKVEPWMFDGRGPNSVELP